MGPRGRWLLPILTVGLLLPAVPLLAQVPAGGEFQVNTYTYGRESRAAVTREPDGDFVVVWSGYRRDAGEYDIFGQRYAATGVPRGEEFRINLYTPGQQHRPSVAVDAWGRFYVVWDSFTSNPSYDADIRAQRYDASGVAVGGEFIVNTYTTGLQMRPRVGATRNGGVVIVWQSQQLAVPHSVTMGRRFGPTGQPLGGEFEVTTGDQFDPALDVQADGRFVVAWAGPDGSGNGIFARRFDASGDPLGADFMVSTYTTSDLAYASVAVAANGAFVVVWQSQDATGIFGQRFGADGARQGGEFRVNQYSIGPQHGGPTVEADDAGNFVVTWTTLAPRDGSESAVLARRYAANGAPRSGEFTVNTYTTGPQDMAHVQADPAGNFVVAWRSDRQDGFMTGVFAQRFGGLHPRALDVDPAGNRVLEPGEAVPVRPSWQNLNGAAQTFTGALAALPDVSNCIHAVVDGTADYGTVANGATAPCTDCYVVSAGASTPRCRQHWDIRTVESIFPEAQGQAKQWLIHVGGSFTDVMPTSPFYRFVETLFHHGLTAGCGGTEFCPADAALRGQMAVFVLLGSEGTGYQPPACYPPNMFDDVPETSPFCSWVEEFARRGVVAGCAANPPRYCPDAAVTREQMAVFVLRMRVPSPDPPPCVPPNMFDDVPETSPFCRWIEEAARSGAATGCSINPPLFCPQAPVSREQMAVFISVMSGLSLYAP